MWTWYAFTFDNQETPTLSEKFDIEHIYSRKRQQIEHGLSDNKLIDKLGNKILLEKSINIKASDYRFDDKKKFYLGEMRRSKDKRPSRIVEIKDIAAMPEFGEQEIKLRNQCITDKFIAYIDRENLLQ